MGKTKTNKKNITAKNKQITELTKELEDLKDPKGKLTIANKSPMSHGQLKMILSKTPEQHVHERPGKGGGKFKYVTGVYIKKALNYIFGWRWSFEILDKQIIKDKDGKMIQIFVQGKLTVRDDNNEIIIVKEQFGGAEIKYLKKGGIMDIGNDMKSAATDALKKCASELGLAGDVYGENEFKEILEKHAPVKKATVQATITKIKKIKTKDKLKEYQDWVMKYSVFNENQKQVILRNIEEQEKLCV